MNHNNNKKSSFNNNNYQSQSNGTGSLREMNRNVPNNNNFKTTSSSFAPNNNNQQRPRNNFQENNMTMNSRQNNYSNPSSNNVNPQNNILNLFGNLSNLLKSNNTTNNNNNNSMTMSNSNDMPLSTIFESVALLQALTNPETLNQTISLLNNFKNNSNPQPILVEDEPAPSGSEIMGNNAPMIQKENNTHSFSFLEKMNNIKNRPETVNHTVKPVLNQSRMNVPEKSINKNHLASKLELLSKEKSQEVVPRTPELNSGINKNQLASKLELLLSVPPKEKTQEEVEFEEIKTPEISPQKTPTKTLPIETKLSPIKSPSLKPLPLSPPPLAFSARPNTFHPLVKANNNQPISNLLNVQIINIEEEPKQKPESPSKPKLLDFFEDKIQLGTKEKDVEKHQRQYKLMGSDRPLLTQEKNLLEKLERFANKDPEEKKAVEQEKDKEEDEFNFESRYFMYNPTQVCNRCKKPGHFEKMCSEENLIKCGFCVGSHKIANCDQIVCFRCFKVGHRMQNCQSHHSVICYRCQKKGHTYHNCGVMLPKDPKATVVDKERDMDLIKCSSCNQFGHINCKFVQKMWTDDLYQDYRQNN